MPRADVVPRAIPGALEHLYRVTGAAADVAVRDDLGALRQPHEVAYLHRAAALEDALEGKVHGARDVTVARVAVRTGGTVELERLTDVEQSPRTRGAGHRTTRRLR